MKLAIKQKLWSFIRRPLFKGSGVLPHMTGQGEAAFSQWKSHHVETGHSQTECTKSLFIEPVCWMSKDILHLDGKVSIQYL